MPHTGTIQQTIDAGSSKTIHVYCKSFINDKPCHYMAPKTISDLPRTTWAEIERRFTCPKCNTKGNVEIRFYNDGDYHGRACNIIDGEIIPQ